MGRGAEGLGQRGMAAEGQLAGQSLEPGLDAEAE